MPKSIYDLGPSDCRYITSQGIYCAEPMNGMGSFCAYHHRVCYRAGTAGERGRQPIHLPIDPIPLPEISGHDDPPDHRAELVEDFARAPRRS